MYFYLVFIALIIYLYTEYKNKLILYVGFSLVVLFHVGMYYFLVSGTNAPEQQLV